MFLQAVNQGNRTRATMKAINAAPIRPSSTLAPTECDELFVRLMRMKADKSAMCAINRHLLNVCAPQMPATEKPKKFDLNPLLNLQLLPYDTD